MMQRATPIEVRPPHDEVTQAIAPDRVRKALDAIDAQCKVHSRAFACGAAPRLSAAALAHVVRTDPMHPEPLTVFHSASLPPLSLTQFSDALIENKSLGCDEVTALIATVLLERYSEKTGLVVTQLMMHRLFAACLLVAAKVHLDRMPLSLHMSRVAGIELAEMNRLELTLAMALNWHLVVTKSDVLAFFQRVIPEQSDDVKPGAALSGSRSVYVPAADDGIDDSCGGIPRRISACSNDLQWTADPQERSREDLG